MFNGRYERLGERFILKDFDCNLAWYLTGSWLLNIHRTRSLNKSREIGSRLLDKFEFWEDSELAMYNISEVFKGNFKEAC